MHTQQWRIVWLMLLPVVLGLGAWAALADPGAAGRVVGGFQLQASATRQSVSEQQVIAGQPSLVVGSLSGDLANPVAFVAFTQRGFGTNFQDVLVRFFAKGSNQWRTVAQNRNNGSLNRDRTVIAGQPSLEFGGPLVNGLPTVPWVAWQEPVRTISNKTNIFAAFLSQDASGALWQITGEQGGNRGVPGLNADTSQNAANPAIATGATTAGATTFLPWTAWDEDSPINRSRQVFVARAEASNAQNVVGGFRWVRVGAITIGQETGLNVDSSRNAQNPDIVFSSANNTTPWVTWFEDETTPNQGRAARVFAARAVADATAQGGFRLETAPSCAGGEFNCTLNANQDQDARNPKIASGMLVGQTEPQPWVVFEQTENNGAFTQIIVKQWTGTAWRPVGRPLNVNAFARAYDPDIFFIGNVPHVAWVEDLGGFRLLYVRHLADVRPGQERWDLDANLSRGLNVVGFNPAVGPSLHGTASTPYVAWEERNRFGNETLVFEARRVPEGPAWGTNRPPFIRVISGTRAVDLAKQLPLSDAAQASLAANSPDQAVNVVGSATITTSCDHVNGWDNISEIDFKLANDTETALLARFDGETGRITVLDPVYNTVIGSGTPGVDGPIETPNVTVHLEQMSVTSHGADSPAVDINWVLDFKRPLQFKEFTQLLNIKSRAQATPKSYQGLVEETGFFEVGTVAVRQYELTLPGIVKGDQLR